MDIFSPLPPSDPLEPLRHKITATLAAFGISNQYQLDEFNALVSVELSDYSSWSFTSTYNPSHTKEMPWLFPEQIEQTLDLADINNKKVCEYVAHYAVSAYRLKAQLAGAIGTNPDLLVDIARHFYHAGHIEGEIGSRFFKEIEKARTRKSQNAVAQRLDRKEQEDAKQLLAELIKNQKGGADSLAEKYIEQIYEVAQVEHSTVVTWIRNIRNGKLKV